MASQRTGYYLPQKHQLLKKFDKTAGKVRGVFVSRYGGDMADKLIADARHEYKLIIPDIPYVDGPPALNVFLKMTALELALYKAMKRRKKGVDEIWEVCHDAIKLWAESIPGFMKSLIRFFMYSSFTKKRAEKIARKTQKKPMGDFVMRYVEGDGESFDWGVDYLGCSILNFVRDQGAAEFAPYVCMSDIPLSDAMGWGLIRTETLADGCSRCDFRFKKGSDTWVSSKTYKVQKTIDRILRAEALSRYFP